MWLSLALKKVIKVGEARTSQLLILIWSRNELMWEAAMHETIPVYISGSTTYFKQSNIWLTNSYSYFLLRFLARYEWIIYFRKVHLLVSCIYWLSSKSLEVLGSGLWHEHFFFLPTWLQFHWYIRSVFIWLTFNYICQSGILRIYYIHIMISFNVLCHSWSHAARGTLLIVIPINITQRASLQKVILQGCH